MRVRVYVSVFALLLGVDHERGQNGSGRQEQHATRAEFIVQQLQIVANLQQEDRVFKATVKIGTPTSRKSENQHEITPS